MHRVEILRLFGRSLPSATRSEFLDLDVEGNLDSDLDLFIAGQASQIVVWCENPRK